MPVFLPVTAFFCLIYQEKRKSTFSLVLRNVDKKKVRTSYLKMHIIGSKLLCVDVYTYKATYIGKRQCTSIPKLGKG